MTTHAESIDLVDMVTAQLAELGAEGLFCSSLGCGCSLADEIMPCGEPQTDCEPGRVVEYGADGCARDCEMGGPCDFHVVPLKRGGS